MRDFLKELYVSAKEPWVFTEDPHVSTKEPYLSIKEPCISTKEPYLSTKEPCVSTKEPWTSTKEPYVSIKEPWICTKEAYVSAKEPCKSGFFWLSKCPSHTWAHIKYPSSLCVCTRVYEHTHTHHPFGRVQGIMAIAGDTGPFVGIQGLLIKSTESLNCPNTHSFALFRTHETLCGTIRQRYTTVLIRDIATGR